MTCCSPARFTHLRWQRKRMMTASLISTPPWYILHRSISPQSPFSYSTGLLRCTFHPAKPSPTPNPSSSVVTRNNASSSSSAETETQLLTPDILSRVSAAKDADEALQLIHQTSLPNGLLTPAHCSSIISAAFTRNNPDLALSVYHAMRASFQQQTDNTVVHTWKWSRPDVSTYSLLVRGLAMSLRVPDALEVISDVCRPGVSHGQEVPFGVIVKCPCCMIAVSVAQPQHGSQIVSCFKCRYQYELVSGTIASIESEAIRW